MNKLQFKLISMVSLFYGLVILFALPEYTDLYTLNITTASFIVVFFIVIAKIINPDKDLQPALKKIYPDASSSEAKAKRIKYMYIYFSFVIIIGFSFLLTGTNPEEYIGSFTFLAGFFIGPILVGFLMLLPKTYKKLEKY